MVKHRPFDLSSVSIIHVLLQFYSWGQKQHQTILYASPPAMGFIQRAHNKLNSSGKAGVTASYHSRAGKQW